MQKIPFLLIISFFIALCGCENSGVKLGIDTEIIKIMTQLNFTQFLAGTLLINETEMSGTFLIKYDLKIQNLTLHHIISPVSVDITHTTTSGYKTVNIKVNDFTVAVTTDFEVKFGISKESGKNTLVTAVINYFFGSFYLEDDGKLVIADFSIDFGDIAIDFESSFSQFFYGMLKQVVIKKAEESLAELKTNLTEIVNNWVVNETLVDTGYGIGINLTCVDKPILNPYSKIVKAESTFELILQLVGFLLASSEEETFEDNTIDTSILKLGVHGSVYPNSQSSLKADISPAVNMDYIEEYFDNEVQALVSDYTVNTVLFLVQQTGYLHQEFTTVSNTIFPFDFNVDGLSEQIPEYKAKYPDNNFDVEMKAYVKIGKNKQPVLESSKNGMTVRVNFGVEFLTSVSDDPFDDPETDLSVNVTTVVNVNVEVVDDIFNVNIDKVKVESMNAIKNSLDADMDNFKSFVENNINDYVIPLLDQYLKNIDLFDMVKEFAGIYLRNLRVVTKENYIVASVGVNGLN